MIFNEYTFLRIFYFYMVNLKNVHIKNLTIQSIL